MNGSLNRGSGWRQLPRHLRGWLVLCLAPLLLLAVLSLTACEGNGSSGTPTPTPVRITPVVTGPTPTPLPAGPSVISSFTLRQGIGSNPTDLRVDVEHHRLYVLCTAELDLVDIATGHITRLPLPPQTQILAIDSDRELALLGGSGGTGPAALIVVDGQGGTIVRRINLPSIPWRTVAVPQRDLALVALEPGQVAAVKIQTGQFVILNAGGPRPSMLVDADAGKAYLSGAVGARGNLVEEAMSIVDLQAGKVEWMPLPERPTALALYAPEHRVFALHQYSGSVTAYSPDAGIERTLRLSGELTEVAIDTDQGTAFVLDWASSRVLVLDAHVPRLRTALSVPAGSHLLSTEVVAGQVYAGQTSGDKLSQISSGGVVPISLPGAAGTAIVHPLSQVAYVTVPSEHLLLALAPNGDEVRRWTLSARPGALALDQNLNKLFVALPDSDALALIDLATRAQDVMPHALTPSGMLLNPNDGLLYISDSRGNALYAFSPERGSLVRAIPVGPQPGAPALNPNMAEMLVPCSDGLYAVSPGSLRATQILQSATVPIVAVGTRANRIYVGAGGGTDEIQVLDATSHTLLRTAGLRGIPIYLGVDEATNRLLLASEDSEAVTLSLLDADTFEEQLVSTSVSTRSGSEVGLRWDMQRGKVFLAKSAPQGQLLIIDMEHGEVQTVARFEVAPDRPAHAPAFSLEMDAGSGTAYFAPYGEPSLLVIDSQSSISTTLQLQAGAAALAIDPARSRIYAALTDGSLSVGNARRIETTAQVSLGMIPQLLLVDSAQERVFATDALSSAVRVIRDPVEAAAPQPTPERQATPTLQAPMSPWTTFANGDQVRVLAAAGRYVWTGTSNGGILRWDAQTGAFRQFLAPQDGLRSNDVYALAPVSGNDVWAATSRGLSHFDGMGWTTYQSNSSGLPGNSVRALAVDGAQVWAGVQSGEASMFDGRQWVIFSAERLGTQGTWAAEIAVDALGQTWFASWVGVTSLSSSGIVNYTAANSGLPQGAVTALLALADGTVWAGTDAGLAVFNEGVWTGFSPEDGAPTRVWALAQTSDGVVWAAADSGIFAYDGSQWAAAGDVQAAAELYSAQWADITARSQKWPIAVAGGKIWAIVDGRLATLEGQLWTPRSTMGQAPPSNQARALGLAADGTVWAGFASSAATYDGRHWEVPGAGEAPVASVNAIAPDASGRMWLGTDTGVSLYDAQRWTHYVAGEKGLLNARALALAWDGASEALWVGSEQGISVWRQDIWTSYTPANSGLSSDRVQALAAEGDGTLWCATAGGVVRYADGTWSTYTDAAYPATEQEIWGVALDGEGHRWFGARQSVRRLSGSSWFNYRDLREAIEYDYRRILNTKNNPSALWAVDIEQRKVWVTVEGGAAAYNGRTWEVYTPDNSGLVSDKVRAILVDSGGAAWFATDKGLSRLAAQP